jgi:uroporphyrin-III C-methyltransferase
MPVTRAWLIGAGPGDVELLTLKAARALALADVVLMDDLVNPDTLRYARDDVRVTYVGKRGGRASMPQHEIIRIMLGHLREGRSVARLKGGDPFIFGRGGEELQALHEAGVHAEVINGITAGIAAPTAIGIPLTRRDYAQGVIFVTGHSAGEQKPDWRLLAATGMTLVVYMGITRLEAIVDALLDAGMAADMPSAAIESATRPDQRHVLSPLAGLARAVAAQGLGSPAIVVIGAVVGAGIEALALDARALA